MTTKTQHNNDAAVNAYMTAQNEARALLGHVAAYLDGHQDCASPEEVHWAHVGDIQRVIAQLKDIMQDV